MRIDTLSSQVVHIAVGLIQDFCLYELLYHIFYGDDAQRFHHVICVIRLHSVTQHSQGGSSKVVDTGVLQSCHQA